jgi:hypothetical protein
MVIPTLMLVYTNLSNNHNFIEWSDHTIFPCAEVISWFINEVDIDNRLIRDTNMKAIASFQTLALDVCYKFPPLEVDLDDD